MQEKIPPQDIEAEQSLLGAMMMSKDAIARIVGKIKASYFYKPSHTTIFQAIINLFKKNEPIDLITVSSELKKNDKLTESGGRAYLVEVIDSVPTAANIEKYADIVSEKALLRLLIDAGSNIISESFDQTQEVTDVLESAQKQIQDISRERIDEDFTKLDEVLKTVFENIQSTYDTEEKILGVTSGFTDLDTLTSGFQKSDLLILAARPAMGKTTMALNFAVNAAVRKNIPIAIFSLEMPKEQLAMRLLSSEAKIDGKRLRTANLKDHEYKDLVQGMGKLSEAPIYIDDTPAISPLELRAKCRRLQTEADIKLIIIDYLQLMRSGKKRVESRFQEVSEIVREIKAFAKESNLPILALSQLSRDIEKRAEKIPQLSDLRESGEIEQTADIVMFLYRENDYSEDSEKHCFTKLVLAKHRNGPTGIIDFIFRKDIARFLPAEKTHAMA